MSDARRRALTIGALVAAAAAIGVVHAPMTYTEHHVKETSDVYWLPPPADVVRASLGYRAALVDVLWAHVLVSQGLHTFEKRRFENLTRILDTINELEPTFPRPYLNAEWLVTFQTSEAPQAEVRKAREIMERGTRARPDDAQIWLLLGEFTAYLAPNSYLKDPAEADVWRREGTVYLERAAELGSTNPTLVSQALGGAAILRRSGQSIAALRYYRNIEATVEDPEILAEVRAHIAELVPLAEKEASEDEREEIRQRDEERKRQQLEFQGLCREISPTINKTARCHALGPPASPALCAGFEHALDPRCAITWRDWSRRIADEVAAKRALTSPPLRPSQ